MVDAIIAPTKVKKNRKNEGPKSTHYFFFFFLFIPKYSRLLSF